MIETVPLGCAVPYMDDILVCSDNPEQHLKDLAKVLDVHKKAGLLLEPDKCHLFRSSIDYLGHTITADGIAPSQKHLSVIKDWPVPRNKAEVKEVAAVGPASPASPPWAPRKRRTRPRTQARIL